MLAVAKRNGNELFIQNIERENPPFSGVNTPPSSRNTSQRKNSHSRGVNPGLKQLKGTPSQQSIVQALKAMRLNADDFVPEGTKLWASRSEEPMTDDIEQTFEHLTFSCSNSPK